MRPSLRAIGLRAALPAAALLAVAGAHAPAAEVASTYSSAAGKVCRTLQKSEPGEGEWAAMACPGKGGYVVRIGVDDLRTTVSVGTAAAAAAKEPAATQGFRTFNHVEDKIEWRGVKGEAPFAIIQRWWLTDPKKPEDRPAVFGLLLVTRLPPGPVCHIAYVDARLNPKANQLARRAADDLARDFKCGSDTVHIVGARGRALELAEP
jgi:hypothetical protein